MWGRLVGAAAAAIIGATAIGTPAARADDQALLALGTGVYDFSGNGSKAAGLFRGEYRFGHGLWLIKPVVGAQVTTDSGFYVYGGLRADVILADHYVIMPIATVGYWDRGQGHDLGSSTEFKTGAEFAYRFDGGSRLGIAFDHISNAGISHQNPGEETLLMVYSLPLGSLLP